MFSADVSGIVSMGNFTKKTNNFKSIEQRNNSSTEEALKTAYYKSKDSCKNLKTDWLKIYRMQMNTYNPVENPR